MEYIYAALLLHKLGKKVDETTVKAILQAAGATPDDIRTKALVAALSEVDIGEALKNAIVTQATASPVPSGTKPEPKKEVEEKKDEEALAGLSSLFG